MGWNNQAVSLIILTEETSGFSGLFGYSPTVGLGSLIFSVAAVAGVDPYGNSYPQGVSSDVGNVVVSSLTTSGTLAATTGPILLYGNQSAQGTVFAGGASGNWTAPSGVTSVTATIIGAGGPGYPTGPEGAGGGGGGCAMGTFAVVPGNQYAYSVGTSAVNQNSSPSTFMTGTGGAGGFGQGSGGGIGGPGGGASGGSVNNFSGGQGGGNDATQGGGGSSAGPLQAGNNGGAGFGGAAVPGGGAGGYGASGSAPGGGGGGGSSSYIGGDGQITLNWSTTSNTGLVMSLAAAAGNDSLGNSWVGGLTLDPQPAPGTPGTGCVLYYTGTALYAVGPSGHIATLATT